MPPGTVLRDETASVRDCAPAGAPSGPLRVRDRHRAAACAAAAPRPPAPARDDTAAHEASAPGAEPSRTSRPPAGRTPAALQVFRC